MTRWLSGHPAGKCRARFEHVSIGLRQTQRLAQPVHRSWIRLLSYRALQIGDAARAQRRALGECFLGQSSRLTIAPQDFAESDLICRPGTWNWHCPRLRPDGPASERIDYIAAAQVRE